MDCQNFFLYYKFLILELQFKNETVMKKIPILLAAAFVFSCSKKNPEIVKETKPETLQSKEAINNYIKNIYNQEKKFEWSKATLEILWSAGQQSDKVYAIGYKPLNKQKDISTEIADIDINNQEWIAAKNAVLQIVLQQESKSNSNITLQNITAFEENILPVVDVVINDINTLKLLLNSGNVRYVEPMGYEPTGNNDAYRSSSGCGGYSEDYGLVNGVDYTTISPNAKQSWNHSYHGITAAWNRNATGQGVGVFIIDTGIEYDQDNFGTQFNQGASTGRTITKLVTLPRATFLGIPTGPVETPDDGCGHGTAMAGACAAPRGTDGNAAGIAYNSNLFTCRAAEDVLIDGSRENKGVADAFTNAANRTNVKVISMSMGRLTSASQITDAINYAYGKGKLIFCAAGTSFGWTSGWYGVIFPAWLSNVNAVTGIQDNLNTQCNACHDGSEVDFTIVMEKAANERHALTTATVAGNQPGTVGGSSVATAQTAGIAALVFSRFPTYTRDQVLNKLITTSSNYPTKNGNFGWGRVRADLATQ
jgi:subtilisin family serine protease